MGEGTLRKECLAATRPPAASTSGPDSEAETESMIFTCETLLMEMSGHAPGKAGVRDLWIGTIGVACICVRCH